MYFDTIEYENVELIWSSSCDHELKLMEVDVSYSQMDGQSILRALLKKLMLLMKHKKTAKIYGTGLKNAEKKIKMVQTKNSWNVA